MNYVMNDFSLRGQFKDMESFLDSIRNNIKPILRKIEAEEDGTLLALSWNLFEESHCRISAEEWQKLCRTRGVQSCRI